MDIVQDKSNLRQRKRNKYSKLDNKTRETDTGEIQVQRQGLQHNEYQDSQDMKRETRLHIEAQKLNQRAKSASRNWDGAAG